MKNITVITWPAGRRSVMAQMLEICLGSHWTTMLETGRALDGAADGKPARQIRHNTLPQTEDRHYLIEYEEFPISVVLRYEGFVARGGKDSFTSFRRFASEDYDRFDLFKQRWILSDYAQEQVVIDAAELRANPKDWLQWALGVLAPEVAIPEETQARALDCVTKSAARGSVPVLEEFRYHDAALFAQLAALNIPRAVVKPVFQQVMANAPTLDQLLILQTEASPDSLRQRLQSFGAPSPGALHSTADAPVAKAANSDMILKAALSKDDIALAYQLFLGRQASEGEVGRYLERGVNGEQIRRGFIRSVEFANIYTELGPTEPPSPILPDAEVPSPIHPTLIHLHVPKTAGTSLNHIIESSFDSEAVLALRTETLTSLSEMPLDNRRKLLAIKGHLLHGVAALLPQPALYLVILRQPGPRIFSLYRYIKRQPDHPLYHELTTQTLSFGAFLSLAAQRQDVRNEVDNGQIRRIANMFDPEFFGQEAAVFQQALLNIFAPDMLFGLTDHFDDFLLRLKQRNLIPDASSVHMNAAENSEDFQAVLAGLTAEEQNLYDAFTGWDSWFYNICAAAYFTYEPIRERLR